MEEAMRLLQTAKVVFWDFDGVIKDSVSVKSDAFEQLFLTYGKDLAHRVRRHHEAHGGLSRYEKIPIYLQWAGEPVNHKKVSDFSERFSRLVRQAVIDAPWVPGVPEYLQANCTRQCFVLVTATPQEEIQEILLSVGISHCFYEVHGAPTPKSAAIRIVLQKLHCSPRSALIVGDSDSDLAAGEENELNCLVRRTPLNLDVQKRYPYLCFDDLDIGRV